MKVRPNPYIISFSDEADGGPEHFVYLMKEYRVRFKKKGELVSEGEIHNVEHDVVEFYEHCECCDQLKKHILRTLVMGDDFDEIEYQ